MEKDLNEDILRKVKNLLNRTTDKGATPEEMDTCINLAYQLMEKYAIGLEDVKRSDIEFSEGEFIYIPTKNSIDFMTMLTTLCELFHCGSLQRKTRKKPDGSFGRRAMYMYRIVGEKEHALFVEFLVTEIMLNSTALFLQISKEKGFTRNNVLVEKYSYERGYFDAVVETAEQRIKERDSLRGTGTSLMVVDSMVKDYLANYGYAKTRSTIRKSSQYAYELGKQHGKNQSLDKRVNRNVKKLATTK